MSQTAEEKNAAGASRRLEKVSNGGVIGTRRMRSWRPTAPCQTRVRSTKERAAPRASAVVVRVASFGGAAAREGAVGNGATVAEGTEAAGRVGRSRARRDVGRNAEGGDERREMRVEDREFRVRRDLKSSPRFNLKVT